MLTKAEWDAMEPLDKHFMILEKVFGWPAEVIEGTSKHIGTSAKSGLIRPPRAFTTDRNACALVLDEIERRGLIGPFMKATDETDGLKIGDVTRENYRARLQELLWLCFKCDSDTICYCVLKAVEDAA